MVDFHTHILPDIDDGSATIEESVRMLEMLEQQGVKKVVLSPHFYAYSSEAEQFVEMRDSSLSKLVEALKAKQVNIDLYLGCEVLYFDDLWRMEGLKNFCIKGTDYIMVELPMAVWTDSVVGGISKLISKGLTPVIVHFERYLKYKGNKEKIYELIDMGACLQMNCECMYKFFSARKAIKFFKNGLVSALGSDCHNTTSRTPNCADAYSFLKEKLNRREYAQFRTMQNQLLKNAEKVYSFEKQI